MKRAWITGASQGIGRALACELAKQGWLVAVSARNQAALQQLAEQQPGITPFAVDVTDRQRLQQCYQRLKSEWGMPDWVILNAGTHIPTPLAHFSGESVRQLFNLNVLATLELLAWVLADMRERNQGRIGVMGSLSSYRGLPSAAAYGAGKAALHHACEALQLELMGSGVSLKIIHPGFVETPLTARNPFPMPFLISAEEAARRIVRGMQRQSLQIVFPRRLAWPLALLRLLPYRCYATLIRWFTGYG